jgi:hypothetical protein
VPLLDQAGADLETAFPLLPGQVRQWRTPQSAAGGKQRDRFKDIGFACAVFSPQQVELRRPAQLGLAVVAKMGKGDAIKRHITLHRLAFRRELTIVQHQEITNPEC